MSTRPTAADLTASRDVRAAVVALTVLASLVACTGVADSAPPTEQTGQPPVVSHAGLAGIRFGDARADLERDHGLTQQAGDCGPRLPSYPGVSPVFEDGRLVLMWAEPPVRTPDGIAVGTAVETVRDTHPGAEKLTAPAGSHRFDGLLAVTGDRAYLFLHDGAVVQKLIVGYEEHCRRLFHEGFGVC